ncbi:uncharacterized protein LOC5564351 [Aedes aegypti]|uniref:Odorant receptor n=1 Tax=Aedes aegypti TaxID=7159 RepID=A0A1S4F7A1_AEDAE|nr:odorant receptor 85 [Aedes aegypti]
MKAIVSFWKTIRYYETDSDYFVLLDMLADLCGFYPPKWKSLAVVAWIALKVGQVVQYAFYTYHCYQSLVVWRNMLYFSLNINLFIILSVGLFRALTLAYYHRHLITLKNFVNSRQCGKTDNKANYMRKVRFWTNNRLILGGSAMLVLNAVNWCLTAAFTEDLYQIPFSLQFLPTTMANVIAYYYSFQMLIQNFTYWQSFFQFGSLLSLLNNELAIISDYFESIFDRAFQVCSEEELELRYGDSLTASKMWETIDKDFRQATKYHSDFIDQVGLLKKVTYFNFLALLSATAILVTLNSFLCVIDFSSDALGLLVFGSICCMECFFTCRLLDELDDVNEEIAMHAYAMDWMTSITVPRGNLNSYRSIKRTALIVQAQAQQGFGFRAGGMFDMNSEMFMQIMEMCYSWITFLMQTQESQ